MNEEILKILKQYADTGALSESEARLLREWRSRSKHNEHLILLLDDQQLLAAAIRESEAYAVGKEANWQRLKTLLPKQPATSFPSTHRIHFLRRSWFRYAAAVILLIGITVAIVMSSDRQSTKSGTDLAKVVAPADIDPGGNKAILTLGDGTNIILDSAADGSLAQQGGTRIIKLTNGQLAYRYGAASGRPDVSELLYNTISTPRGGQYQIVLPDGTKVWLNAASSIRFPAAFVGDKREVAVTGEVYMEVVRNSRQPFFVHTNQTRVEVLGTSFNINAYEDENAVKTTLVEGSVKVINENKQAILKPGQQAVVASSDRQSQNTSGITIQSADIEQTLAWKNSIFNFNNADLKTVMRQLERWYDIKVQYQGNVGNPVFGGTMDRREKLSFVLDGLQDMGIKCKMDGKTLIVTQ